VIFCLELKIEMVMKFDGNFQREEGECSCKNMGGFVGEIAA
jgi:hypothetical protein